MMCGTYGPTPTILRNELAVRRRAPILPMRTGAHKKPALLCVNGRDQLLARIADCPITCYSIDHISSCRLADAKHDRSAGRANMDELTHLH